nr:hypothetical protein [Abalone asfa-like virus]
MLYMYSFASTISWIVISLTQNANLKLSDNFAIINKSPEDFPIFTPFYHVVVDLELYILFDLSIPFAYNTTYIYVPDGSYTKIKIYNQTTPSLDMIINNTRPITPNIRQNLPTANISFTLDDSETNPLPNKIKTVFLDRYQFDSTSYPETIYPVDKIITFNITSNMDWFAVYFELHIMQPSFREHIGMVDINPPRTEVPFCYVLIGKKMYIIPAPTRKNSNLLLYLKKGAFHKVLAQDTMQINQLSEIVNSLAEQKRGVISVRLDENKCQEVIQYFYPSSAFPEELQLEYDKKYPPPPTSAQPEPIHANKIDLSTRPLTSESNVEYSTTDIMYSTSYISDLSPLTNG